VPGFVARLQDDRTSRVHARRPYDPGGPEQRIVEEAHSLSVALDAQLFSVTS